MFDNYLVRLYRQRGQDNGVTLRYGKNIIDIKQEKNIADTITGVMPYWYGQNENQESVYVSLPEKVIRSSTAANYPYQRTIVLDCSGEWQDPPTEAQLRGYAQSYITQTGIGIPKISIDVSFVALWQTEEYKDIANLERVRLCDTVTVEFEPLGISAKAKVVKTEYDILKERYRSIELGDARTNFAGQVKADIDASSAEIVKKTVTPSFLQREINRATELIRGGLGGYVVFTSNADGQPQEIIIMDTDDVQTAVQCIRINKNGIGFSTTGYNGPYTSAWTIDGRFNADFIATGSLTANLIKGGILKLGGTDNGNGVIQVFDGNNVLLGQWDKDGLIVHKGSISGTSLRLGGLNNVDGVMQVYDASGNLIGSWSKDGLIANSGGKLTSKNGNVYVDLDNNEIACSKLKNPTGTVGLDATTSKTFRMYNEGEEQFAITFAPTDSPNDSSHIFTKSGCWIGAYPSSTGGGYDNYGSYLRLDNGSFGLFTQTVSIQSTSTGATYITGSSAFLPRNSYLADTGHKIAYEQSSAKRYKHDIRLIEDKRLDPHNLLSLPVVQFVFDKDHEYEDMPGEVVPGIIAEDVERIYPNAAVHRNGKIESWDERRIIPGMLALIQEQDKKIKDLEARLARLEELLT